MPGLVYVLQTGEKGISCEAAQRDLIFRSFFSLLPGIQKESSFVFLVYRHMTEMPLYIKR